MSKSPISLDPKVVGPLDASLSRNRYVALLDIMGFADLCSDLELIVRKVQEALISVQIVKIFFAGPGIPAEFGSKPFRVFSFSDTFVVLSNDSSKEALLSFLAGVSRLTRELFALGLPVRGAITYGEAAFIPNSDHAVGMGIIRAHQLEKIQDWMGVLVDEEKMPTDAGDAFKHPWIKDLFVRWKVPIKTIHPDDQDKYRDALVVNWRFRLTLPSGTKGLFTHSDQAGVARKIENTLKFAKYIRDRKLDWGQFRFGKNDPPLPWLEGISRCPVHGDEY